MKDNNTNVINTNVIVDGHLKLKKHLNKALTLMEVGSTLVICDYGLDNSNRIAVKRRNNCWLLITAGFVEIASKIINDNMLLDNIIKYDSTGNCVKTLVEKLADSNYEQNNASVINTSEVTDGYLKLKEYLNKALTLMEIGSTLVICDYDLDNPNRIAVKRDNNRWSLIIDGLGKISKDTVDNNKLIDNIVKYDNTGNCVKTLVEKLLENNYEQK